jgi:hypothetical protein
MASNARRWILRGATAVGVLLVLFVMDIVTGSQALSGWPVAVTALVINASTGTPIQNARVSYAFSFDKEADYEPTDTVADGPMTRFEVHMQYCRFEGGVSRHLKAPAHPVPSMYRFEFDADGFLPQRIDGSVGGLVEDPGFRPERGRFGLRLPEVRLKPVSR